MSSKALVIGCGNIGALYDADTEHISNHASALSRSGRFELHLHDEDKEKAEQAARNYQGQVISELSSSVLDDFDWISICTPTETHYKYLELLKGLSPKKVLCEKPVAYDVEQLNALDNDFSTSGHETYVNYFRRFLPSYIKLKKEYSHLISFDRLTACQIVYCRGFLNSASHAFDLLEFLFQTNTVLSAIQVGNAAFDAFKEDPTISMTGLWNGKMLEVEGENVERGPLFEIHLSFDWGDLHFTESGNKAELIRNEKNGGDAEVWDNCLSDYMKYIVEHILNSGGEKSETNFASSLALNLELLRPLNYIHV